MDATVADSWNAENRDWDLRLRRKLKDNEIDESASLSHILTSITLKPMADSWVWTLEPSKKLTVCSTIDALVKP